MKFLDSLPMRKEPVFSTGGAYDLVIQADLCLHQAGMQKVFEVIADHLTKTNAPKTLCILDLACGGKPVIPCASMKQLPNYSFVYTGVDLNKDQVDACKKFPFPKNVKAEVREGNVWEVGELPLQTPYDIVFMGLNSHHALPEEIFYAAKNIYKILKPNGLFLNHDVFRPSQYPYLRKPDSLRFISREKLKEAKIATPLSPNLKGVADSSWREGWFAIHKNYMLANGFNPEETAQGLEHIQKWDWPVSLEEMSEILGKVRFKTAIHHYQNTRYPRPDFFGLAVGVKP